MDFPPVILVHGAWHDSHCWEYLAPRLRARGCRVRCPDLPGHGSDALPADKVTLGRYVDAVEALLQGSTEPVMLVGHSMAGLVIGAAASRMPEKVRTLVYLCAYLPVDGLGLFDIVAANRAPGEEPLAVETALQMSPDKRLCHIDPARAAGLFYSDLGTARAAVLARRLQAQPTLPLSSRVRVDQRVLAALSSCYVACSRDRVIPLQHQRRMLSRQPCTTLLQIQADHSPFYSCPEQLAELLFSHGAA